MADHEVKRPAGRGVGRWLRALAGMCVLLVLAACGQPHPTLDELRDLPEASAHPVGSVLVQRGGSDSDDKLGAAPNQAVMTDLYATDDDPSSVLNYYRTRLGKDWTENDRAAGLRSDWSEATTWESDDYILQVGIENASYVDRARQAYPKVANKRTLFVLQLQAVSK